MTSRKTGLNKHFKSCSRKPQKLQTTKTQNIKNC